MEINTQDQIIYGTIRIANTTIITAYHNIK